VWTAAEGLERLGTLGGDATRAEGVNNAGQVVGSSSLASGVIRAVVWTRCLPSPPVIRNASVSPSVLWPPNHKMVRVHVAYSVKASCGATATSALSVRINDRDDGGGDGHPEDAVVIDAHTVMLRAERSAGGHGRTYTIRIDVTDSAGREAARNLTVVVPRSRNDHRLGEEESRR
jgi:hypothetical protein